MSLKVTKLIRLTILMGLLLSMSLLTGCGNKKEIVFWNPFTGLDGEIVTKMVDDFNATNPEYTITNVPLAAGDIYTKVPLASQSGEEIPDFGVIHYYMISNWIDQGILVPMNEVIAEHPEIKKENYLQDAWEYGERDEKRYALPLDMHGAIGYYNVDLMNKYGPNVLDDGKVTWEEIQEMGELSKADGITAYGGAAFLGDQFFTFVGQLGGDLVKDGKPNIDSPEAREAIARMTEIFDSGYSTVIGDDNYSMFSSGKVIFTPEGTWTVTGWRNDYPELNYAVAPMLIVGDTPYNFLSSHQFVIYNKENSKEKPEVTEAKRKVIGDFLEYMRTNSDTWATAGHLPAALAATESAAFKALPQSVLMDTEENRESLRMIDYTNWQYVQDACNGVLEDILRGNLTVDEGLAKAQKEAQDKIAEVE